MARKTRKTVKNNQIDNDIEYSPADFLGGAPNGGSEQHGFKLALDSIQMPL
jgi:hypothetical protein